MVKGLAGRVSRDEWLMLGGAAILLLLATVPLATKIANVLSWFIPSVEGFRAHPYWDVSRYSWGYGTRAPGPTGTISREQAFADMQAHLFNDYEIIKPLIHRSLNANQWAALLSLAYNAGKGAAFNLVEEINNYDAPGLEANWKAYKYADGLINSTLVARRAKEWALWNT